MDIVNKTRKPLRIQLHGGKVLHLGPGNTGQISNDAAEEPAIRRLVKAGEIEIVDEAHHAPSGSGDPGAKHEAPRGHHPTTVVLPKGDR
ncbi:MAG TPA: hypothetical protein VJS92_03110 [Candidatus Polarisedimenticolaceae bacterium]|nr:hypothetical protein [Candidatus Polarisedimenticolaceae bacterium]